MADLHRRPDPVAAEMQALGRRYNGLVQQFRLEELGQRLLVSGPIPVAHSSTGFSGDRVTMVLDGGTVVRLKLYWPMREVIASLRNVRWHADTWVIDSVTAAGVPLTLRAWRATVTN